MTIGYFFHHWICERARKSKWASERGRNGFGGRNTTPATILAIINQSWREDSTLFCHVPFHTHTIWIQSKHRPRATPSDGDRRRLSRSGREAGTEKVVFSPKNSYGHFGKFRSTITWVSTEGPVPSSWERDGLWRMDSCWHKIGQGLFSYFYGYSKWDI
jgi:hypothetical protein